MAPAAPAPSAIAPSPPPLKQAAPLPAKPPSTMESAQAWLEVKETKDVAALERFLNRHGESIYGDMARARLAARVKTSSTR